MSTQPMTSVAEAIRALPSPYPPINLIKHYKGATLNQQGQIVDINPQFATIQATQRLTFHILDGIVHLRSGVFSGAISAKIHPIDYKEGTFQLSNLSYGDWRDRKSDRVQPKYPTHVAMIYHRKTYRALLEDISNEGMGILVNSSIDLHGRLQPGTKLLLEFRLAPWNLLLHLRGSIVYKKQIEQHLLKFGLQLHPNTDQKKSIQVYTMQRHDEILNELEQDYFRICDPCRVEDQYF
jgi:PilZ domain